MAGERPSRARRAMPASRAIAVVTASAMLLAGQPAFAQPKPGGPNLPLIRDAEIEQLMRDYTAPILKVAGLAQQNVQVVLINERAFNAFVMDGRRIFVNVGALYDSKTPNEIIGVLAHETGHMAGGHLSKLREQFANAQTASIIAMVLGAGAAGWPTSMCTTRPPRASMAAAAAITSITMKGGTSLRADGEMRRRAVSSIKGLLLRSQAVNAPRSCRNRRLVAGSAAPVEIADIHA